MGNVALPGNDILAFGQRSIMAQISGDFVPVVYLEIHTAADLDEQRLSMAMQDALADYPLLDAFDSDGNIPPLPEAGLFGFGDGFGKSGARIIFRSGKRIWVATSDEGIGKKMLAMVANALFADTSMLHAFCVDAFHIYMGKTPVKKKAIPFADYISWQQKLGHDNPDALKFWRSQRTSIPANNPLYLADTPGKDASTRGQKGYHEETLRYEDSYGDAMQQFCRTHNCSPEICLLLCYIILLQRLSSDDEVCIGICSAERDYEEFRDIAGPLARLLPLRFAVRPEDNIPTLVRKMQTLRNDMMSWSEYCPSDIQAPAFGFEWNDDKGIGEMGHRCNRMISMPARFSLLLNATAAGNGWRIRLIYDRLVFSGKAASVISRQFDILLDNLLSDWPTTLKPGTGYERIGAGTEHMSIPVWEKTYAIGLSQRAPVVSGNVVTLFEAQVRLHPHHIAVHFQGQDLSYQELNAGANRLSHMLMRSYGVGKGDIIAVALERGVHQLTAFLGILKAGAAFLPIETNQPASRQESIIGNAGVKTLITDSHGFMRGRYSFFEGNLFVIDIVDASSDIPEEDTGLPMAPEDTAYLIYTSGSTGVPKGVEIGHYSLANYVTWFIEQYAIRNEDATILFSSLCYDLSYSALWPALCAGCRLVLEEETASLRPEYLLEKMVTKGITFAKMTPSHFNMLVNSPGFGDIIGGNRLRLVLLGGEPINVQDLQKWYRYNPATTIVNHYGPTETTIGVAVKNITPAGLKEFVKKPVIGRPIAGNRIFLLDQEGGLVPPGMKGQLAIAGPGLAKGYYRNPDATRKAFVPLPCQPSLTVYLTGDIGVWTPEGDIMFLGRKDSQLKIRGFRVEAGEIETALLRLQGVTGAKVLMLDGELVAILTGPGGLDIPLMTATLGGYLTDYMIPRQFLLLASIPMNANGKIDLEKIRKALREQDTHSRNYAPPQNETERCLAAIFEEVLNRKPIGIHDDFFQYGGHSLRAVQVVTQVHRSLNRKIEVRTVFEYPTIYQLAGILNNSGNIRYEEIPRTGEQVYYDLSHSQKRFWVLNQMESKNISYNRPASYLMEGPLKAAALESAFRGVIDRHESLRTTYHTIDGVPVQKIMPAGQSGFRWDYVDLSDDEHAMEKAREYCNRLAAEPFDLSTGPLIRTLLVKLSPDQHVCSFILHHIVSDAWSIAILTNELFLLYNAARNNIAAGLPPLRIQYRDFASWQNAQIEQEQTNLHRKYWMDQFSGGAPVLLLPADFPRPAYKSGQGRREIRIIDPTVKDKLQHIADREGVSLYMLLLTLMNVLLSKYSGQTDIVIGSPIAGRNHPDLEDQIGIYLNTLPIRTRFSGTDIFRELLLAVKENVLNAFEHSIYPFDRLLEDLRLSWDTSHSPLFDVALVLQNVAVQHHAKADGMEDILITPFEMDFATSAIDLRIEFTVYEEGLGLVIDYNTDLFTARRIRRMMTHFEVLAAGIDDYMDMPVTDIDYIGQPEKIALFTNFGAAAATHTTAASLDELFKQTVTAYPHEIALVSQEQRLSYSMLDREVDKLTHYLQHACQIGPGDYVGVHLEKTHFFIISILAISRSGGVYTPIDPNHPATRKEYILRNTGARILLTSSAFMFDFEYYEGHLMAIDLQLPSLETPVDPLPVVRADGSPAYVIYTSGSTGLPKGVIIDPGSILRRVLYCNSYLHITKDDVILQFAAQGFDASLYEIYMALIPGGRLVMPNEAAQKSIPKFLDLLQQEEVTVVTLPPAFLKILDRHSLYKVRSIISTGEAALLDDAIYYAGIKNYYNGYGPTEACIGASFYKVDPRQKDYYRRIQGIPIGSPFADTRIYILDEAMHMTAIGNPGEIYVASFCLASGYLNDPDLSASKFLPNPFRDSDGYPRLYRTGDLGRWNEDGQLEFIGRVDSQIQINGIRVEPNEVAAHLLKHPDLRRGAVAYLEGRGLIACVERKKKTRLWPDINVVNIFDDILYHAMGKDDIRIGAFAGIFSKYLPGKTVLDVGTGKDALLARLAVDSGADKVYAVELNETAYRQALQLIEKDGLSSRIILIKGDIRDVQLPEQVDYLIHDLSGNIGGAAGASVIIESARRFLKDRNNVIPRRYLTHAAAFGLMEDHLDFAFEEVPARYVRKIFEQTGYPFDLRICLDKFEQKDILSERAPFEIIDFRDPAAETRNHEITLSISKEGLFTGLILGLDVMMEEGAIVDNMKDGNTILPVYIPLFHPGIDVRPGDTVRMTIRRKLPDDGIHPDFHLEGRLERAEEEGPAFVFCSAGLAPGFRESSFYARLFGPEGEITIAPEFSPETVRAHLRQRVPSYMVPQKVIVFDELPLNVNGKIDIRRITEELEEHQESAYIAPAPGPGQQLAGIWKVCLEIDRIGIHDNFFERGANSLRVIRALKLLDEAFPDTFQISDIFSYPTISAMLGLLKDAPAGVTTNDIEEIDF